MDLSAFILRSPEASDAAQITKIDAEGLSTGHASFREEPYHWEAFKAGYLTGKALSRVALHDGSVVAWGAVSPTSARKVYAGVGEVSVYVGADRRGRGAGRCMLSAVVEASESAGYWTLVAQIFPENIGSLALHRSVGFEQVGIRRALGRMAYGPMAGKWRDVVMLERRSGRVGR